MNLANPSIKFTVGVSHIYQHDITSSYPLLAKVFGYTLGSLKPNPPNSKHVIIHDNKGMVFGDLGNLVHPAGYHKMEEGISPGTENQIPFMVRSAERDLSVWVEGVYEDLSTKLKCSLLGVPNAK